MTLGSSTKAFNGRMMLGNSKVIVSQWFLLPEELLIILILLLSPEAETIRVSVLDSFLSSVTALENHSS